jgi:hypothetical protein
LKKPVELPSGVAKGFVKDMRAFFAEEDATNATPLRCANFTRCKSTKGRAKSRCDCRT